MPSYNEVDGVPSHVNSWLLTRSCGGSGDSAAWSSRTTSASSSCGRATRVARTQARPPNPGARGRRRPRTARSARLSGAGRAGEEWPGRRVDRRSIGRPRCCARSSWPGCSRIRTSIAERAQARHATRRSIRPLALEAARKSIVLLKNEGRLLPLDRAEGQDARRDRPQRQGPAPRRLFEDPGRGVDVLGGITAGRAPA